MDYLEEKTPSGITLKVLFNKWHFIAFDRDGGVIYAEESEAKVLHKIPVMVVLGDRYRIVKNNESELAFFKIIKGEIIIPYTSLKTSERKYFFIEREELMDLMPIRIREFNDVASLVREKDTGLIPDYIVIDQGIPDEDCQILGNRYGDAIIIQADHEGDERGIKIKDGRTCEAQTGRASDVATERNLNIMSNNPVFLSRIHLRDMALSKVNQLLLDFDISSLEADYMLKFIESMLENKEGRDEIEQNKSKLETLKDSFQFYIYLVNKNDEKIHEMINEIADANKLASYNTLVAKMKILFPEEKDLLKYTDYENLLFEKKDQIQEKESS